MIISCIYFINKLKQIHVKGQGYIVIPLEQYYQYSKERFRIALDMCLLSRSRSHGWILLERTFTRNRNVGFTANWLEARTIKYINFPAKYMNSRSKLHWNIHVVLCQVGVTWNNRWGIGIPELHDHAERHSTFNSSPKWILLFIYFYAIFWYFPH